MVLSKIFPASILFFFIGFFHAQVSPPGWTKTLFPNYQLKTKSDAVSDGYSVIYFEKQCNTLTHEYFYRQARKVETEAGLKACSQLEVTYDPSYESVTINAIKVIRKGIPMDRTKRSVIRHLEEENDRSYGILSHNKTIFINLDDIVTGDIVEFSFTTKGKNPLFKNSHSTFDYLGFGEPTGQIYVRYIFKASDSVSCKLENGAISPELTVTGALKEYVWNIEKPPVTLTEEKYPSWYIPYPYAVISTFNSWSQIKEFCVRIVNQERGKNKKANYIVDTTIQKISDPSGQFVALTNFVQNNIRYTGNESGIYGFTAHAPDEVLTRSYGDCKDKSVLLCELLSRIGIEAYPALVSTTYKEHVKNMAPHPFWFDHCIVAIKDKENKFRFIDPTIPLQGGGAFTRKAPSYGTALVLSGEGSEFVDLQPDQESKSSILERFEINDETGDATLVVTSTHTGLDADDMRYYLLANSLPEIQTAYKNFYMKYCPDVKVLDTIKTNDNIESNILTVTERYLLKGFWTVKDSLSKKIETSFIPYTLNDKIVYVESKTRKFPLAVFYPVNIWQRIEVFSPGGWNIANDEKTIKNSILDYRFKTLVEGSVLVLDYSLKVNKPFVSPEEYQQYKKATDFIDKNIVFNTEKSTENYSGFNYMYVLTMLLGLGSASIMAFYLNKRKMTNNYITKYTSLSGWLVLVVIGLIITPLFYLITLIHEIMENINLDFYSYYLKDGVQPEVFLQGLFELFIVFFNHFSFVFYIFLAILCLRRKRAFRLYYVVFKFVSILFIALNIVYLIYLNAQSPGLIPYLKIYTQETALIKLVIQFALFGGYIWFSERSRHTFTQGDSENDETVATETAVL